MSRLTGANGQILIDQEDVTYKVDNLSPDGKSMPFLTCSIKPEQNLLTDETINGSRNAVVPDLGNINVNGALVTNLDPVAHAHLWWNLMGTNVITASADPFTHTMKVGALPISFTLEVGDTVENLYYKYNGCRIQTADFALTNEGYAQMTWNILGANVTKSGSSYDGTPTTYTHQAFTSFQASITEGGSAIATISDISFTVDNTLDEGDYTIDGTAERRGLAEGKANITGSITARFLDDSLLLKARNSTESALVITLDQSVTPARTTIITIPEIKYGSTGHEITGAQGLDVTLPFQAFYTNASEGTSLQVAIQNGLSAL